MAYEDWDRGFHELFDELPGIPLFRDNEYFQASELFEAGFMHRSDEPGYDRDAVMQARDDFFEYTGLPPELFDWEDWREAMGYGSD